MNRTTIDTDYRHGGFFEISSNDREYKTKIRLKQRLQNSNYLWYRFDGTGNSQFYDGRYWYGRSYGHSTFAVAMYYGYLSMPFGGEIKYFDSNLQIHVQLENRMASAVKGSSVNALIALGEYRQTASLYRSTCDSYVDLVGGLVDGTREVVNDRRRRRGNRRNPTNPLLTYDLARRYLYERHTIRGNRLMQLAKAAADAWLIFSFGFRPLYNDLIGAAQALAKSNGDVEKVIIETFKCQINKPISSELSYGSANYPLGQQCGISGTVTGSSKVHVAIVNPLLRLAEELGITNPIYAAWNLIPKSFVFDWFVPVGEYLKGITPPVGIEFVGGHTYVKAQGFYYLNTQLRHSLPNANLMYQDLSNYKDRRILNVMPMPELVIPDLSLSKEQIISGMALVIQKLSKIMR